MISNPKYGYCNIKMGDYEDLCDTTDLPLNIARAFISYYESGSGYSYIKNDTYFILENDKVYILKENKERQLIERQLIKNVSVDTLAYESQEDILKCPEAWVREFMVSDFSEDLKTLRNMDEIDRKKRLIWILNDEEKHKTRYLLENIDTLKKLREKQKGIYVEKKKNNLIGYYVLYFKAHKMENNEISYKDVNKLRKYVYERGKILPRRITGNCAKHQRALTVAIKRARHVALMPYVCE